jgi:hypothetical protein
MRTKGEPSQRRAAKDAEQRREDTPEIPSLNGARLKTSFAPRVSAVFAPLRFPNRFLNRMVPAKIPSK